MLDRPAKIRSTDIPGPCAGEPGAILPIAAHGLRLQRGGRTLIDTVDFTLDGGGVTLLMGPNGAGKSLLLRLLAGLVEPDSGTVRWNGRVPDRARAPRVGFVFQKPVLLRRSALANVTHALKIASVARAERRMRAMAALEAAKLDTLAAMPARLMSGGEQQRLALARALAAKPDVLMLDEPTASLDPGSVAGIESLVLDAAAAGTRILFVSHDIGQARRLADDVAFMHAGAVVERAAAASFFERPRTDPAAKFLAGHLVLAQEQVPISNLGVN